MVRLHYICKVRKCLSDTPQSFDGGALRLSATHSRLISRLIGPGGAAEAAQARVYDDFAKALC